MRPHDAIFGCLYPLAWQVLTSAVPTPTPSQHPIIAASQPFTHPHPHPLSPRAHGTRPPNPVCSSPSSRPSSAPKAVRGGTSAHGAAPLHVNTCKPPTTRRPHAHNNMTFFRLCAFRAREPRSALERISAQRSVSMDMAPWCVWCILDAVYAAREVKVLNNTPSSASATITTPDAVDVWARARVCLSRNGSNCLFGQVSCGGR